MTDDPKLLLLMSEKVMLALASAGVVFLVGAICYLMLVI